MFVVWLALHRADVEEKDWYRRVEASASRVVARLCFQLLGGWVLVHSWLELLDDQRLVFRVVDLATSAVLHLVVPLYVFVRVNLLPGLLYFGLVGVRD